MNPSYGGAVANHYLAQQINGATPERLMFMLLEGAQRFLIQAVAAIRRRDIATRARMVNRVSSIVEDMRIRLNHEYGGERDAPEEVPADVLAAWRGGDEKLPERWYALDVDAAKKAWAEGVKRAGEEWYRDGPSGDAPLQLVLLGELRYG